MKNELDDLVVRDNYQGLDPADWTADEFIHYRYLAPRKPAWHLLLYFLLGVGIAIIFRMVVGS